MKFIKKFKLFESTELDEIISNINDILLEFSDNNIEVNTMSHQYTSKQRYIEIDIKGKSNTNYKKASFKLEDYKNEIDTLFDYLRECGYSLSFIFTSFEYQSTDWSHNVISTDFNETKRMIEYIEDVLISHVKLRFTPYKLNVFWCS